MSQTNNRLKNSAIQTVIDSGSPLNLNQRRMLDRIGRTNVDGLHFEPATQHQHNEFVIRIHINSDTGVKNPSLQDIRNHNVRFKGVCQICESPISKSFRFNSIFKCSQSILGPFLVLMRQMRKPSARCHPDNSYEQNSKQKQKNPSLFRKPHPSEKSSILSIPSIAFPIVLILSISKSAIRNPRSAINL